MDIMSMAGIYVIENIRSRRVYVGATKSGFWSRWRTHWDKLRMGVHKNRGLQQDWRDQGVGWFKFMVLEELPVSIEFASYEQAWIDTLRDRGFFLYNVQPAKEVPAFIPIPELDPNVPIIPWVALSEMTSQVNVSTSTLRNWIYQGTLSAKKLGNQWMVRREEVARLLGREDDTRV